MDSDGVCVAVDRGEEAVQLDASYLPYSVKCKSIAYEKSCTQFWT